MSTIIGLPAAAVRPGKKAGTPFALRNPALPKLTMFDVISLADGTPITIMGVKTVKGGTILYDTISERGREVMTQTYLTRRVAGLSND